MMRQAVLHQLLASLLFFSTSVFFFKHSEAFIFSVLPSVPPRRAQNFFPPASLDATPSDDPVDRPKKKRGRPPKKRLPDTQPPPPPLSNVAKSPISTSPEGLDRSRRWAMVVEPPSSSFLAADILRSTGYIVTTYSDLEFAYADVAERGRVAVLGEFAPGNRGKAADAPPDIVVLDADAAPRGSDALDLVRRLRSSSDVATASVPVLALSRRGLASDRIECYRAGVDGFLTLPCDPEELVALVDSSIVRHLAVLGSLTERERTIRDVASIRKLFRPRALPETISERAAAPDDVHLTPKEVDVLELLCKGMTNASIAAELGNTSRTIEGYVGSMLRKTNLANRMELLRWAVDMGLVE